MLVGTISLLTSRASSILPLTVTMRSKIIVLASNIATQPSAAQATSATAQSSPRADVDNPSSATVDSKWYSEFKKNGVTYGTMTTGTAPRWWTMLPSPMSFHRPTTTTITTPTPTSKCQPKLSGYCSAASRCRFSKTAILSLCANGQTEICLL